MPLNPELPQNTKLLAICTSFRRPHMLPEMLDTFYETRSPGTEIFVYLHLDDPLMEEYLHFIDKYNFTIGPHRNIQETINHVVFERYPNIPYYQVMVDDGRYRTIGWDSKLISGLGQNSGWGFACGRDLSNGDNWDISEHPSMEIFSYKQAATLGYAYPRNFRGLHLDYYAKDLGKAIGGLTLVKDVVIEHLWFGGCDRERDINIQENYSPESVAFGDKAYTDWVNNERETAIGKIKTAMKTETENYE